jgi:hypothetical protein
MSNNVQTAAEWKQVAAEQEARAKAIDAESKTVQARLEEIPSLKAQLNSQFKAAQGDSARTAELTAQSLALNNEQKQLRAKSSELALQYSAAIRAANEADKQASAAETGPPNDNSIVQPAGASSNANSDGSNTSVPPTQPAPNIESQQTVADDPFEARRLELEREADVPANEITLTPEEQAAADDPFEQRRLELEQEANRQELLEQATDVEPTEDPFEARRLELEQEANQQEATRAAGQSTPEVVVTAPRINTATIDPPKDWRVRISLAPESKYFYNGTEPGILKPLKGTGGVIFPYTPQISVVYNAQYDSQTITHSNFKMHNYTGSSVDSISITGDFTAQDTTEAAYMLAVIHFFKSATKMFYGRDLNPSRGVPPPLLYLTGHGSYQFDHHPMVLTSFNYSLPVDVDYINAYPDGASSAINTVSLAPYNKPNTAKPSLLASGIQRLLGSGLQPGGQSKGPVFVNPPSPEDKVTRVPTKISISLTFLPIITRNAISNGFSLKDYASGKLLQGSKNPKNGGGIW